MKGEHTGKSGYGRLLDAWSPPDEFRGTDRLRCDQFYVPT